MMEPTAWAEEHFGSVDLGDVRRTARLVRVAASAAAFPAGTVTKVFADDAERQGAYDFLESPHVKADALEQGAGQMVSARCASEKRILVAVDGSSLSFVDREGARGLGAVGSYAAGGLGLKVISALALSSSGVPIGLLRQVIWRRPVEKPTNRRPSNERPIDKKETKHCVEVRPLQRRAEPTPNPTGAPKVGDCPRRRGLPRRAAEAPRTRQPEAVR